MFERTLLMMDFLIANVGNDFVQLRVAVRECPKAFLSGKLSFDPMLIVDELRRSSFDVPDKIGQCNAGFQTNQQMNVIGNAIDLQHLLVPVDDDSGDEFVEFFFVLRLNQTLSPLNGENYLNVNLSVSVRHFASTCSAR